LLKLKGGWNVLFQNVIRYENCKERWISSKKIYPSSEKLAFWLKKAYFEQYWNKKIIEI